MEKSGIFYPYVIRQRSMKVMERRYSKKRGGIGGLLREQAKRKGSGFFKGNLFTGAPPCQLCAPHTIPVACGRACFSIFP